MFSLGKRKQNRQNEPIGATEYFKEFDPDHIRLSDDRMSVVWQEDDATAYGNVVISYDNQQTHEWRFKIVSLPNDGYVGIGLDEASHESLLDVSWVCTNSKNYSYSDDGSFWRNGDYIGESGQSYHVEDIVVMELNGMTKMISFQVNDADKQPTFKIEPSQIGYSMAVSSTDKDVSVKLLSYECVRDKVVDEDTKEDKQVSSMYMCYIYCAIII